MQPEFSNGRQLWTNSMREPTNTLILVQAGGVAVKNQDYLDIYMSHVISGYLELKRNSSSIIMDVFAHFGTVLNASKIVKYI
jgi:hypothetical protein